LKLLLDTHIWIWSLLEPNRLVRRVRAEIESPANELWLSPLSVWEFFMLCRKGRVAPEGGPQSWLSQAMSRAPLREAPLTFEIALETERMELPGGDPVDRFLVATARSLELTLVTTDRRIVGAKGCSILSNR
jgi:PIN domain nuclease of toxin-antitoxin system